MALPLQERRRALIKGLVGKKVSLSTSDFHHVVGRLIAVGEDDRLELLVKNKAVHVRQAGVVRIQEADPALAEYIK